MDNFFNMLDKKLFIAPMAGGVSNPKMVISACKEGVSAFLAAGYKTPELVAKEIKEVNDSISNKLFGLNIFVPGKNTLIENREKVWLEYKNILMQNEKFKEIIINENIKYSDDYYYEKIDLLLQNKNVPIVSFTFGCPSRDIIKSLHKADIIVIVTVTNEKEAQEALYMGADILCVQSYEAGGHRATFSSMEKSNKTSLNELIIQIKNKIDIPLIATGGIYNKEQVKKLLAMGLSAVQIGTMFITADESGASEVYKRALLEKKFNETILTTAFTGKYARALKNNFVKKYTKFAPSLYPEIHFLTSKIRKEAFINNDMENINIWAGTGFKNVIKGSVRDIINILI